MKIMKPLQRLNNTHPAKLLLAGYSFYTVIGWLLLHLPLCQKKFIPLFDSLVTAVSAVSTTGLLSVSIEDSYTFWGQLVILLMIQLGGIGYATLGSFVLIAITQKLSDFHERVSSHEFPLPKGFHIPEFIKHVVGYTLACELIGAVILTFLFKNEGVENPLWQGVFHSISAFCTAGISLFSNSLIDYRDDFWINAVISIQCVLGALGFIVWVDVYKKMTEKRHAISFTTRTIIAVTAGFLLFGSILFFLTTTFPDSMPLYEQILISFFQTMTASTTAGFTSMDIDHLSFATITLLLFLMAFGASPSGTGGGLKSTTFATLLGLLKSALRGKDSVLFWDHKIPLKRVQVATSSFIYYAFILIISLFCFTLIEELPFLPLLFEASSALSNIGLSMGITSQLSDLGKAFISLLMFMGRMGIMTFGIALAIPKKTWRSQADHDLVL
jgi:trk system potassium uptake protein TrkH